MRGVIADTSGDDPHFFEQRHLKLVAHGGVLEEFTRKIVNMRQEYVCFVRCLRYGDVGDDIPQYAQLEEACSQVLQAG